MILSVLIFIYMPENVIRRSPGLFVDMKNKSEGRE